MFYSPNEDKYTSYRDVLTTNEERLHAAQQQWLDRYEPLTDIYYPAYSIEKGVAYPRNKYRGKEIYFSGRTIYDSMTK